MKLPQKIDALCVGGGPAGLAAAIALRRSGLSVMVADTSIPPIDKACGEGLMPDGVAALRALGVNPEEYEHAQFRGIRFIGPQCTAEAHFPDGHGIGMKRTSLHRALYERAGEVGVDLRWGARVSAIAETTACINGQAIQARWIVGADGQNSRVRQWAGLSRGMRRSVRIGLRRHFRVERWTDFVEVHWADGGQAYVTPVGHDEICVAVISRERHVDFGDVIEQCPQLARKLRHAEPLDSVRGSATATLNLRSVVAGNVALIGEASGCVDAVTGEGMTLAFRQAVELGNAVAAGDLGFYAAAHRKIGRVPRLLGSAMLLMDRNAGFRGRALKALSNEPRVFERMLALHLGEKLSFQLGISGAAALGWQLLLAN